MGEATFVDFRTPQIHVYPQGGGQGRGNAGIENTDGEDIYARHAWKYIW